MRHSDTDWYFTDNPKTWRIIYRLSPLVNFLSLESPKDGIVNWFCESFEHMEKGGITDFLANFKKEGG